MQVQNNNSQSFGSIKIQTSKMNKIQKGISKAIADALEYTPEYQLSLNKGLDVYILPTRRRANEVSIRFIDHGSDCYLREPSHSIVNVQGTSRGIFDAADQIREELVRLCDKAFKRPNFDVEKIAEKRTDVARINPNAYDDLDEGFERWGNIYNGDLDVAKEQVVNEFINLKSRFSVDENF